MMLFPFLESGITNSLSYEDIGLFVIYSMGTNANFISNL
jgi:hypothetical protein